MKRNDISKTKQVLLIVYSCIFRTKSTKYHVNLHQRRSHQTALGSRRGRNFKDKQKINDLAKKFMQFANGAIQQNF